MIFSEAAGNSFIVKIILNTAQKTYISVEKKLWYQLFATFWCFVNATKKNPKCGLSVQIIFEADVSGKLL